MCDHKGKIGRLLVALFFICSFSNLPLIVHAEGEEETITTPSETGEEWDGQIIDPAPTPTPEPTPDPIPEPTSEPTPSIPTYKQVTSNTPTNKTPKVVIKTEDTPETPEEIPEEAPEEIPEEAPEETTEEAKPEIEYIIDLSGILASYEENTTIRVPETQSAKNIPKTTIIILISVNILFFAVLSILCGVKAYKITKSEKLYKEALTKSHQVKKAKITRAG